MRCDSCQSEGPTNLDGASGIRTCVDRETCIARQRNAHKDPSAQFFTHAHLTNEAMRDTSRRFTVMATELLATLPANRQREKALEKLLEAKDCAVRALLFKEI